ncbi:MAG: TOBE domain-containing protein [Pseudomonadota bacterium]
MGEVNLIEAEGRGDHVEAPFGPVPVAAEGPVTLAIRPEHLGAGGAAPLGEAAVEDAAFFGAHLRVRARLGGAEITAHMPPAAEVGEVVALSVDPALIRVFPR